MYIDITLGGVLLMLLILVGIVAGIALIMVLLKANKILKNVKKILDDNTKAIDTTIQQIPGITYNVNEIVKEVDFTIATFRPDIDSLLRNVNGISGKVNRLTSTVEDTTGRVQETVYEVSNNLAGTVLRTLLQIIHKVF